MAATEESTDRHWRAALRTVVVLVAVSAGFAAAWLRHGDAVELREKARQQDERILQLEKDRERMVTQRILRLGRCARELQICERNRAELGVDSPTASK